MEIDSNTIADVYGATRQKRRSRHSVEERLTPSRMQYDYLILDALQKSVRQLIDRCPPGCGRASALDLGASNSPYKSLLENRGYKVRTLDMDPSSEADFSGTIEATGLPSESFDLVLCTQVLEHCLNPWQGIQEIARILKPGGRVIASAPHVWFYHPHPSDNWRFTQEGIVRLCAIGGLETECLLSQGGSFLAITQIANFLVYGLLGRLGLPVYLLANCAAGPLDQRLANSTFCLNFACLSVKR